MTYCNLFTQLNQNFFNCIASSMQDFGVYDNSVFGSGFMSGLGTPMSFTPSFTPWFNPTSFMSFMPSFPSMNFNFSNMFSNFDFSNRFANCGNLDFSKSMFTNMFTFNPSSVTTSTSVSGNTNGEKVLNKALSYVGNVNNDHDGVKKFSPAGSPDSRGWCCDFATYCASKALGDKYPADMVTGGPAALRDKAKTHNCWVNGWSSSAKPGDIVLLPGNGASGLHVAIIKSIDGNGKITCVSGNSGGTKTNGGGRVKESTYRTSSVKGFVSIEKLG